jgi:uncharacterized membrane protein
MESEISEQAGIWLGVSGLTGLIFIGVSYWQRRWPAKQINHMFGYRTRASMRSQEAWDFAQQYSGRRFGETGVFLILISLLRLLLPFLSGEIEVLMSLGLVLLSIFYPLMLTELALGNRFDKNGMRR